LDAEKTTPYHFYQFWLNAADTDAEKWIKIFTFLPQDEITNLIDEHHLDQSKRILQKRLGKEVTIFVHGVDEYLKAVETTQKLFNQKNASPDLITEEDLRSMEGIVHIDYSKEKLVTGIDAVSFLAETSIFPSKGEARKMIQNGGVSINRHKVTALDEIVNDKKLLHQKYLLIQKGKKNYYLVNAK